MDLPKCRTCGERHRLGVCPSAARNINEIIGEMPAKRQAKIAARAEELRGEVEAKKRGRPRIGEVREKPWLTSVPPMSERTWYRNKRRAKERAKP